MEIAGSVAIVTGAASGLGAATARRLVAQGAQVVIADMNANAGAQLAAELGSNAVFAHTDVSDADSAMAAVHQALAWGHGLHILVNCAGVVLGERILGRDGRHNLNHFRKVINVNLIGTFNMLSTVAEAMSQNQPNSGGERGVIINTASVAAFDGQIGQAAYAASKAAVAGLTLPAARELARQGIRVMAIAPGIFDTAMMASLPEAARTSLAQQIPFPSRFGHPDEYAALAQHIIENAMLNGEVIRLDGALRMPPK